MALIDVILFNPRQFYSSMGNPLGVKGINVHKGQNLGIFFLSTLICNSFYLRVMTLSSTNIP